MESKPKEFKPTWNLQNGKMILPYVLLFAGIILTLSLGSFDAGERGVEYNFSEDLDIIFLMECFLCSEQRRSCPDFLQLV